MLVLLTSSWRKREAAILNNNLRQQQLLTRKFRHFIGSRLLPQLGLFQLIKEYKWLWYIFEETKRKFFVHHMWKMMMNILSCSIVYPIGNFNRCIFIDTLYIATWTPSSEIIREHSVGIRTLWINLDYLCSNTFVFKYLTIRILLAKFLSNRISSVK